MGGHNEATPTSHKKIKHEKENRSQKEGLKKTNKEKKAHLGTSPLPFRPVLLSHHPIIFIRNAFDLLWFHIYSHLHPGGRFA